jgi:putative transcriptional regulator
MPAGAAAGGPLPGGLAGQLLVAAPDMRDPRFAHTVIYMVGHDASGAMGFIINRPFREVPIALVLERLGAEGAGVSGTIRLHYGGPVEPERAVLLHTPDYITADTRVIPGGIAVTGTPEILRAIGAGGGPRRALFTLGYAGWAPGQLEAEIARGDWFVVPADAALVLDDKHEDKWDRAMARRRLDL